MFKDKGGPKSVHAKDGSFVRSVSTFRNSIEKGGKFEPERDRYHLYVSYVCPWATRTLIMRKLKGLEDIISFSLASISPFEHSWPDESDPIYNAPHVREYYHQADPLFEGRCTVPVLWDKKNKTIVNNESSEILRIFNTAFNDLLPPEKAAVDMYPEALRSEIDSLNEWVYDTVNNGVYKSGFARSQEAYEKAVVPLFKSLDRLEQILTGKDYLVGNRLTEADIRLFVTIIRFDPAYHGLFKCNIRTIRDGYPAINLWMKKLYWNNDAFKSSTNFKHIKVLYYWPLPDFNPTGVVPVGPIPDIQPL